MRTYTETRILPYSPAQLFGLVLDIEKYPEFIPWCRGARIVSREANGTFLGELLVSFSHITERYTSRVVPTLATKEANHESRITNDALRIDVTLVSGPFKHLTNHWRFVPHADGCEIHLDLDFEFKSKLLDTLIGSVFSRACEKMVGAFTARAASIYGNPP